MTFWLNKAKYADHNSLRSFMRNLNFTKEREIMSAIFIIAVLSLLVLAQYFLGFVLPLYVVAMGVTVVIAFTNPKSALYAMVVLTMVFERFFALAPIVMGRSEYKIYPIDVLMVAMLVGIAWQFLQKKISITWTRTDRIAFAFMAFAVLYAIASLLTNTSDVSLAMSAAKNYAFYGILYFATIFLMQKREDVHLLGKFVLAGGALLIGFVAYGIFSGTGLWSEFTPLSTAGVRTLAFTHALYLCVAFIVAVVAITRTAINKMTPLMLMMPVWAAGIVGSMMRHLWIALSGALLLVYVLISREQKQRVHEQLRKYAALGVVIAIVLVYAASLLPYSSLNENITSATSVVGSRVTSIADSGDESIAWRGAVWKESARAYMESPLFGIGFGKKVSIEMGKYHDFVDIRNIHNSYLVLLVQMGIVGATLFAAWVAATAWKVIFGVRSGYDQARIATLGICAMFLVAMAFQPYLETNILSLMFWINLGVMRVISGNRSNDPEVKIQKCN